MVATSGVAQAISSTAGRLNPSYRLGTTPTSALPNSSTSAVSDTPATKRTAPSRPSRSIAASAVPPTFGRPTTTSSTSRSVRSLATASSSGTRPLSGTSALAVATIRPGTRGSAGGPKTAGSTPTGTTVSRSGGTRKSRTMSTRLFWLTVRIAGSRRTTRPCMLRNEYQRSVLSFFNRRAAARSCRRSSVIGWCSVASTRKPARWSSSSP